MARDPNEYHYHGTSIKNFGAICREGLRPVMSRQEWDALSREEQHSGNSRKRYVWFTGWAGGRNEALMGYGCDGMTFRVHQDFFSIDDPVYEGVIPPEHLEYSFFGVEWFSVTV